MTWTNTAGNATNVSGATWTDIPLDVAAVDQTLQPGESGVVQVEAGFPVTPTDDLEFRILLTPDGTNYDTDGATGARLINTTSPAILSVPIRDVYGFKLQARATGATDTISVTGRLAKDGVAL